jgi:hypothetical protein
MAVIPACGRRIPAPETATVRIREGVGRIKSGTAKPRHATSQMVSRDIAMNKEYIEDRFIIITPP